MIKKTMMLGLVGGAAMVGLFGTPAGSYLRTAVFKVRSVARDAVPVQFEIDRARQEVEALTPAIRQHIEQMARAEEDVRTLESEILDATASLDKQKTTMLALRKQIDDGTIQKTASGESLRAIQESLRSRLDTYNRCERILTEKKATLASRQKVVQSARDHLVAISTHKKALEAKIEEIQARLAAIEASNAQSTYHFDGSALSRVKRTVADLDRRLNVVTRVNQMEDQLNENGTLAPAPANLGEVTKEIDAKFAPSVADSQRPAKVEL